MKNPRDELALYLREAGETHRSFGAKVRTDGSMISRYISGERAPGNTMAFRIECATGGRVMASWWAALEDPELSVALSRHAPERPRRRRRRKIAHADPRHAA